MHACARYEQTAKLMTKQIAVHKRADQKPAMYKLMLSQIVVLLANDDAVGANVRYQDFLQYEHAPMRTHTHARGLGNEAPPH